MVRQAHHGVAGKALRIPIDKAGRIVLPKEIRDRFGLTAGSEFEVKEEKDRIVLKLVPREPRILKKGGVWVVVPEESPPDVDIVDLIKKHREERIRKFL